MSKPVNGWRLIRQVGDPDPWGDPNIQRLIARGELPLEMAERFRFFTRHQRDVVIPGRTERHFTIADGFSQHYQFGPVQFAAWMTDADAAQLFANEWERWQFIDITDTPSQTERPPMSKADWQRLMASFDKLGEGRRLKREYRSGTERLPFRPLANRSAA